MKEEWSKFRTKFLIFNDLYFDAIRLILIIDKCKKHKVRLTYNHILKCHKNLGLDSNDVLFSTWKEDQGNEKGGNKKFNRFNQFFRQVIG